MPSRAMLAGSGTAVGVFVDTAATMDSFAPTIKPARLTEIVSDVAVRSLAVKPGTLEDNRVTPEMSEFVRSVRTETVECVSAERRGDASAH